jgi:hypothetical protein
MTPTPEAKPAAEVADAISLAGTDHLELNLGAQANSMIGT